MKNRRNLAILSVLMILALLFTGCSAKASDMAMTESAPGIAVGGTTTSGSGSSMNYYDSIAPSTPAEKPSLDVSYDSALKGDLSYGSSSNAIGGNEAAATERKLIKNANFTMETLEYDKTVQMIQDLVNQSGGYIQNSSVSGNGANYKESYSSRSASFVLRIPADRLGAFTAALEQCGSITRSNEYVDEVTDTYYDVTARLETLQIQEDRLLVMLGKATELKDLITLESALSDVRYEIERYQGQLRRLDDQIAMSTVNISVYEVYTYTPTYTTPKTLGERLSQSFSRGVEDLVEGFEDFLVWFVRNIFVFAIWAVIITVAVIILRRRIRKMKQRPIITVEEQPDERNK